MNELSQQTEELLKAAARVQDWLIMIHYDLLVVCGLIFVFGMIIAFKKRRD